MSRFTSKIALVCVLSLLSLDRATGALVTLDEDTTIGAANSYPEPPLGQMGLFLDIVDGPSGPPTVRLIDGGVIGGFVSVRGSSHLLMTGGQIQAITTIYDQATLTLAGGSIEPLIRPLRTAELAGVIVVGDAGTLNLRGGSFFGEIIQVDAGLVNIYGFDFTVEGELPTAAGQFSTVSVRGFYPNGSVLDVQIGRNSSSARVVLHEVPEPSGGLIALSLSCLTRVRWL